MVKNDSTTPNRAPTNATKHIITKKRFLSMKKLHNIPNRKKITNVILVDNLSRSYIPIGLKEPLADGRNRDNGEKRKRCHKVSTIPNNLP
jgi:hypothetical protein